MKLSLFTLNPSILVYFVFGILYIATLFIIAGIDKEKVRIEKPVLLFGFICVTIYMIYLYIVEKDTSMYRYVIYLILSCLLILFSIYYLRKKGKDSYPIDVLILSMFMVLFTYETVYIYTVIITLLAVGIQILLHKIGDRKNKSIKKDSDKVSKIPVGFYMCTANIVSMIVINLLVF